MTVELAHINKSYRQLHVLRDLNLVLEDGKRYCLMGPSGAGKTTLLRILLGLERADSGTIEGLAPGDASVMFQEDRLCRALTAVENLALVMPRRTKRRALHRFLSEILPEDALSKPVSNLSGGQRRRVSLARAMAFPSKMVVLDEPFTGLDQQTRRVVIDFVLRHANGRTLLVSTHGEDDARMLDAQVLQLADLMGPAKADAKNTPATTPSGKTSTDKPAGKTSAGKPTDNPLRVAAR